MKMRDMKKKSIFTRGVKLEKEAKYESTMESSLGIDENDYETQTFSYTEGTRSRSFDSGSVSDECLTFGKYNERRGDEDTLSIDSRGADSRDDSYYKDDPPPSIRRRSSSKKRNSRKKYSRSRRDKTMCTREDFLHDSEIIYAQKMLSSLKDKLTSTISPASSFASSKGRSRRKEDVEDEEFVDTGPLDARKYVTSSSYKGRPNVPRPYDIIFDHIHRGKTHEGNKNLMSLIKHRVPSAQYFQKMPIEMRRGIRNSVVTALRNVKNDIRFMSWNESEAGWIDLDMKDVEARIFLILQGHESASYDVDYKEPLDSYNATSSDVSTVDLSGVNNCCDLPSRLSQRKNLE
uniref:Uncharacterized protein n=1 Tax=Corethron hystrix TaxID=216773 RepID=A0A7S1FYB7_9STRA|mmetsp:Transcript_37018/g.86396  ORF Transcript_37018/g.86396 Transcript_37018/m.86396 type:complete len:347 (+) Transcript_37018:254-1294(+)